MFPKFDKQAFNRLAQEENEVKDFSSFFDDMYKQYIPSPKDKYNSLEEWVQEVMEQGSSRDEALRSIESDIVNNSDPSINELQILWEIRRNPPQQIGD